MYLDHAITHRNTWKFTYTGAELLPAATARLHVACAAERTTRETFRALAQDPQVNMNDSEAHNAKRAITEAGTTVETLSVLVSEFQRNPDTAYHLAAGDVVFLGLVNPAVRAIVEKEITPVG